MPHTAHTPAAARQRGYRSITHQHTVTPPRQRRARRTAASSRGQTLIIFALSLTVLVALMGIALDSVRVFDLYARMQRAAEAGALAGVVYLPTAYGAPSPLSGDNKSAISRALDEIYKDGFGTIPNPTTYPNCPATPDPSVQTICTPCPNPPTTIEIAVCPVETLPSDLRVTITEHIQPLLLSAVGVGTQTISVSAEAEYLPLIQLGSRTNYFGDQMECGQNTNSTACPINDPSTHLQYFVATFDGPADLKESGDPYVYCAEGDADPANYTNGVDPTSAPPTYNGYATNHPQWLGVSNGTSGIAPYCGVPSGTSVGNPDQQPSGYAGPATGTSGFQHPGGYNYEIVIPSGVNNAAVWVFNPYYIPGFVPSNPPPGSPAPNPLDHFQDNGAPNFYQGPAGGGIGSSFDGSHHDAPLFFFNTTFTLYAASNPYDRTSDVQLATDQFQPYDATQADLSKHGCATDNSQVYDPYWNGSQTPNTYFNPSAIVAGGGCVSVNSLAAPVGTSGVVCVSQFWCQLPVSLGAGTYRMAVEGTGLNASTTSYTSNALTGWGQHAYAVKACSAYNLPTPVGNGCNNGKGSSNGNGRYVPNTIGVFGWNNMDLSFQAGLYNNTPNPNNPLTSCASSSTTAYTCLDLGCISSAYAGRTIRIGIFDPGDASGSGNLYIGVVPPSGVSSSVVSYPSQTTVYSVDGDSVVLGSSGSGSRYRPYNGLWLYADVVLPPNYTGDCLTTGSGWWQMIYAGDSSVSPGDKLAVSFTLVGSPEHLVAVG